MEGVISAMCQVGTVFLALVGVFATGLFAWWCLTGLKIVLQKIKENLGVHLFVE